MRHDEEGARAHTDSRLAQARLARRGLAAPRRLGRRELLHELERVMVTEARRPCSGADRVTHRAVRGVVHAPAQARAAEGVAARRRHRLVMGSWHTVHSSASKTSSWIRAPSSASPPAARPGTRAPRPRSWREQAERDAEKERERVDESIVGTAKGEYSCCSGGRARGERFGGKPATTVSTLRIHLVRGARVATFLKQSWLVSHPRLTRGRTPWWPPRGCFGRMAWSWSPTPPARA